MAGSDGGATEVVGLEGADSVVPQEAHQVGGEAGAEPGWLQRLFGIRRRKEKRDAAQEEGEEAKHDDLDDDPEMLAPVEVPEDDDRGLYPKLKKSKVEPNQRC